MDYLLRGLKAILMSAVMFFSLRYLGFGIESSVAFSMVPLLLGSLNVLSGFAYGVTGVTLIAACSLALLPELRRPVGQLITALSRSISASEAGGQKALVEPLKQSPSPGASGETAQKK
jgi:hypothetical protein